MSVFRSNWWAPLVLVLLVGLVGYACSSGGDNGTEPPPGPQTGSLTVTVQDENGAGVQAVTITVTKGTTTQTGVTSTAGTTSFQNLETGSWQVSMTAPQGFVIPPTQNNPVSVTVSANQTATTTMRLQRPATTGSIGGQVRLSGNGIQGAVVSISGGPTAAQPITTPASGQFTFSNLQPGDYQVTIAPPARFGLAAGEQMQKPATVAVGQTATVNYELVVTAATKTVIINLTATNRFTGPSGNAGDGSSSETINRGDIIEWRNEASIFHTVTPQGHTEWANTTTNAPGLVLRETFYNPGTFAYFCQPHQAVGMTGQIVVQ